MSLFIPYSRATILIPSGPASDPERYHLFIVVNDPVPHSREGEVLLVSVSTVKTQSYYDQTCLLSAGSHEFINQLKDKELIRVETICLFYAIAEIRLSVLPIFLLASSRS